MSNKDVIFEALANDDSANISPSLGEMSQNSSVFEIYIKNTIISLVSIKKFNPDTEVGLVINTDLDEKWARIFKDNGILIWKCPFNTYRMPKSFVYSLSYYKLCAFDYLLKHTDYEKYCFMDCDTIAVKSFVDIWTEVENAFLIMPNESGYNVKARYEINQIYTRLTGAENKTISHFSSGFIAGKKFDMKIVMDLCSEVYKQLMELDDFRVSAGDEIVWSLALTKFQNRIHSPRAYCLLSYVSAKNYWIDKEYYDDPTVILWHLPADKRYSLIWAYNYYINKGKLPSMKLMAKASRIRKVRTRFPFLALNAIFQDDTVLKRNIMKLFLKK
jgi:hypothetical protein